MKLLNDISNLNLIQIVVFGSILTGVFYFSFYNNGTAIEKQLEETRLQLQNSEKSLKEKKEELDRLVQFEKDLETDEKSIGGFLDYIPKEMTTVEMFRFITQEAKISGVNIEDKQDHGSKEEEMVYSMKASLKVSGTFPQVVFFLSRLTAQKRILLVDQIRLENQRDNQIVMASMDVYAFRYKTDPPPEEKKKKGS